MKFQMGRLLLAAATIAVWPVSATAQQEAPTLVTQTRVHVKPGKIGEFRTIQARFAEAIRERGDSEFRGVWRNRNNLSEYGIVRPRANYAAFETERPPLMPEREYQRLLARYWTCIDDRDVTIRQVYPELSITPENPPKMVHTITTTVNLGDGPELVALVEELFGYYKKAGLTGYGFNRVAYGGPRNTYQSWRPVDGMASLDEPGPAAKAFEAMGEEASEKWIERYRAVVESAEHDLWDLQEDLSYYPKP